MPIKHTVRIKHVEVLKRVKYVAECSCGYQSVPQSTRAAAEREEDAHILAVYPMDDKELRYE